ncbi:hypothetical protein GCM10022221_56400 [Actinocorallia aurea]
MRRIAAVTATAVALGVGMGLVATPAGAAPAEAKAAAKKWATHKGKTKILKSINVNGTYTRSGSTVKISATFHDYVGGNGWGPGVQFRIKQNGKWKPSKVIFLERQGTNTPVDIKVSYNVGHVWTAKGNHLQVREIALKPTYGGKTGKAGAWKSLY